MERAKRLLEQGNDSIEESRWAVGYEDPASFPPALQAVAGLSAGDYRRRFRLPPAAVVQ